MGPPYLHHYTPHTQFVMHEHNYELEGPLLENVRDHGVLDNTLNIVEILPVHLELWPKNFF